MRNIIETFSQEQAAPSEAEIDALAFECAFNGSAGEWVEFRPMNWRSFARALLARYGAQPAAGVEPVGLGWKVRERRGHDGELLDCFVEAPAAPGMAYGLEVLGDDYTGYGDVEGKLRHCQMIVAWANAAPVAAQAHTMDGAISAGDGTLHGAIDHWQERALKAEAALAALLDKLEDYRDTGAQAVRWAPSSAHWSNELRRLFGDDAREGIDLAEQRLRDAQAEIERKDAEVARLLGIIRAIDSLRGPFMSDDDVASIWKLVKQ